FIELVNQHKGLIYKVCNIYCPYENERQDLYQEIIVQLWKSYPGFKGESRFSTWLYRIALNTAIGNFRKKRIPVVHVDPSQFNPAEEIDLPGERVEQLEKLQHAISQLTEIEKGIVMMFLEERTYEEMEEVFGISQSTLRVKMTRIKEKLKKLTKPLKHGIK
ncbi:MAG TPA: sigma-70 family RNA polymerase sigma factor, partial [Flavitalea sp.]|nr:sigma-70 family RNA polymerase sigma factor [Flavitalea sp.]